MITINDVLSDWLIRKAGAKRVKGVHVGCADNNVCLPGTPPKWEYEAGWTRWKGGKPKHYTRSRSEVLVGELWLLDFFPVQAAIMRLSGTNLLTVTEEELMQAEGAYAERVHLERLANEAATNTAQLWDRIEYRREMDRSTDPESEVLYD